MKRLLIAGALAVPAMLVPLAVAIPVLAAGSAESRPAETACDPQPTETVALPAAAPGDSSGGAVIAARAAQAAGWSGEDLVVAVAVAGAESGFNPEAANPVSTARGMWQIMLSYHQPKFGGADWRDPYANARVARIIYMDALGWRPWEAHTSGAYRRYLPEARAAVTLIAGQPAPSPTSLPAAPAVPAAPTGPCDEQDATPGSGDVNVQCEGGGGTVVEVPSGPPIRACSVGPFLVDSTIAENVKAMVNAASAAGLNLGGSAGRSVERQWELRRQHCGGGWNVQGSRCSPPTGWPLGAGASRHLFYRALDLTCDGRLIRSRVSPCFTWLQANAATYGFHNLPSEPWHFSDTGG